MSDVAGSQGLIRYLDLDKSATLRVVGVTEEVALLAQVSSIYVVIVLLVIVPFDLDRVYDVSVMWSVCQSCASISSVNTSLASTERLNGLISLDGRSVLSAHCDRQTRVLGVLRMMIKSCEYSRNSSLSISN